MDSVTSLNYEKGLCAACLRLIVAISHKTKVLSPGVRMDATTGLWPLSPRCRLCQIILDRLEAPNSRTIPARSFKLFYDNSSGQDKGSLSQINIFTAVDFHLKLSIWSDTGSPAAISGEVYAKAPLTSDNCPDAFGLINSWLWNCLCNHKACQQSISGHSINEGDGPPLPTRILDISRVETGTITLTESKGLRARFCALSYCWGDKGDNFTTTTENLEQHLAGIELRSLPQTFKDAIKVTREVGIRYLWVDALCIIQNDTADWDSEAGYMADVYQNASLVIGASSASNPRQGCFCKTAPYPDAVYIPHYSASGQPAGFVWLSIHSLGVGLSGAGDDSPYWGPLNTRGWALQEWYLARRMVHFMPNGMSWKCRELQTGERQLLNMQQYFDWESIVEEFTKRQLTFETDRLPALQGLANAYLAASADKYLFGTFESGLPEQLIWMVEEDSRSSQMSNMPSWSWASRVGWKLFWSTQILSNMASRACCRLMPTGTLEVAGFLAEGTVSRVFADKSEQWRQPVLSSLLAVFRIWRPYSSQKLHGSCGALGTIGVVAVDQTYYGKVYFAFLAVTRDQWLEDYMRCHKISSVPDDPEPESYNLQFHWVLLLTPTKDRSNYFRRIGMGVVYCDPNHESIKAVYHTFYVT